MTLLAARSIAPGGNSGGSSSPKGLLIAGIILLAGGALNVLKPDLGFRMNRWQFKNKDALEPSSARLVATRVAGAVAVVAGIVLIIVFAAR